MYFLAFTAIRSHFFNVIYILASSGRLKKYVYMKILEEKKKKLAHV